MVAKPISLKIIVEYCVTCLHQINLKGYYNWFPSSCINSNNKQYLEMFCQLLFHPQIWVWPADQHLWVGGGRVIRTWTIIPY